MHRQIALAKRKKNGDNLAIAQGLLPNEDKAEVEDVEHLPLFEKLLRRLPDTEGDQFCLVVGAVIGANAIILGLETDLGQEPFIIFEHIFGVFFTAELCLRMHQLGPVGYVTKGSNCFDFFLVCSGDFDLWVSPLLSGGGKANAMSKVLKLLKMCRVLRIMRLFKMFHELQIIVEAFMQALTTVCWVGLLTVILNYICAVFLTQTIGHEAAMWGDKSPYIQEWFGSIGASMRTLFIIITLAEWDEIALVVSEQVNGLFVFILAILYITVTAFTMVSLITGIICEELVGAQKDDESHKMEMIEKGEKELASNVQSILQDVDADQSGTLSEEEVNNALFSPDLRLIERLAMLDIITEVDDFRAEINKMRESFGTQELPIAIVADMMKHLRGDAKASSLWDCKMYTLQYQTTKIPAGACIEEVAKNLDKLKDDARNATLDIDDHVQQATARLDDMEERFQVRASLINRKLDGLAQTMESIEKELDKDTCEFDATAEDRLGMLEHFACVLANQKGSVRR